MFSTVKILMLLTLIQFEVRGKSITISVSPKPFNERIKTRRIYQKLDSRFSDDDIVIDGPKLERVKLNQKSGIIPEGLDSRFSFDGESNGDENSGTSMEYGEYYQGDLELMPEQDEVFRSKGKSTVLDTRTGQLDEYYRWPKNSQGYVIVPYLIHDKSGYTKPDKARIRTSMKYIEKYTCIRFVETQSDDFVLIYSGKGCFSNLGRTGGQQEISLQRNGCLSKGTIVHELIHALGFDHMQNHAKRDKYVNIYWDNIKPNHATNFEKVNPRATSNFDTDYDYYSVMHYHNNAFAKDPKYATILPKDSKFSNTIGQREGMSYGDAIRLNNMYECFD